MKAIVFDLDDVLCSTDVYHYQAWKFIADELRIDFNEKINHQLLGISRMDSLEILLGNKSNEFPSKEKETLATKKTTSTAIY